MLTRVQEIRFYFSVKQLFLPLHRHKFGLGPYLSFMVRSTGIMFFDPRLPLLIVFRFLFAGIEDCNSDVLMRWGGWRGRRERVLNIRPLRGFSTELGKLRNKEGSRDIGKDTIGVSCEEARGLSRIYYTRFGSSRTIS